MCYLEPNYGPYKYGCNCYCHLPLNQGLDCNCNCKKESIVPDKLHYMAEEALKKAEKKISDAKYQELLQRIITLEKQVESLLIKAPSSRPYIGIDVSNLTDRELEIIIAGNPFA